MMLPVFPNYPFLLYVSLQVCFFFLKKKKCASFLKKVGRVDLFLCKYIRHYLIPRSKR